MELFDMLDCRGGKTGEVTSRDEAHRTGTWHGAFHCTIVNLRQGTVLFQKRSHTKTIAPGKYDVSAGGHYAAGEPVERAAPREIREELGLEVQFSELVPLGRRVFVYCFTEGIRECEFQDIFLLPRIVRPEQLKLQRDEVDGVVELTIDEGIAILAGEPSGRQHFLVRSDGGISPVTVAKRDFVPCVDDYYLKLLLLARRYRNGERSMLVL
jgi:isopentenyldiphosphate isomerase